MSLAGIALVAIFGVAAAAALHVRGRVPFVVAALVLAAADVVGSAIVLSPLDGFTRGGMLTAHAVLAIAGAVAWWLGGHRRPPRLRNPLSGAELGPLGIAAVVLATVALAVQLYVLARVAPSNWDSMTYHLSRAAYWLQYHSVGHFPHGSLRQLYSAPNAEILVGWTMLLSGADRWVEIVQWLALAGLGLTIFSGARMLRLEAGPAAFAAAVFVLLPQPLLQSTTTQNDLVAAFFVAAAALFLARGMRDRHLGDVAIAAVAAGLAIGTKTTALLAAPAIALIALAAWRGWRPDGRFLVRGAVLLVAGVVAFGSFNYVLNAIDTGDPFGGLQEQVSTGAAKDHPARNLVRDMWSFADTGGVTMPWLDPVVQPAARRVLGSTAGHDYPFAVDAAVQEDTSAFGLVGFLVLPLLLLVSLLAPRASPAQRVLALGALSYLVLFGLRIDENPWIARLLIPAVALAAPLLAGVGRRRVLAGAVLALAVVSAVPSLLSNPAKPLAAAAGSHSVFDWSRRDQITVARPEMAEIYSHLDDHLPADAPIALVANEDSWDYPLFGPRHDRRVVRIPAPEQPLAALSAEHVDGVLFLNVGSPPAGTPAITLGADAFLVVAPGRDLAATHQAQ